jgi:hypothetical protein
VYQVEQQNVICQVGNLEALNHALGQVRVSKQEPLLERKVRMGQLLLWVEGRETPERVRVIKVRQILCFCGYLKYTHLKQHLKLIK